MAEEVGKEAIEKQLEIMGEQQNKSREFVDQKLEINIEPEKGWKTEDMFVPAGFHIDAEMTGEDEEPEGEAGEQPFSFPMGVGGVLMNGCYGTGYQPGDPCYEAYDKTTICMSMIDGAAFIGVGFDGRGDYSPESRKMSIVQRDCSGRSTYDDFDVPDTMNVHGVYDTSATMQTFFSREEYQQSLQQQSGMAGSLFGFYGGVKKAWGSSSVSGSQKYLSVFSIDIDRYEIYLDEVKPGDISVNFLREFMDLPLTYLAPGAAMKFQDFILRWGTHYIKSGKFGGRLQIFKTMEASEVSSKSEFSQVMEAEFRSLFVSFHAKSEQSSSSSQKQQTKASSTSVVVEGGDQEIAALISDMESPTIKHEITQWLESIRTFPKPFKFMVAPITNLLKFNVHSLFPDDDASDWGCEAKRRQLKKDEHTGQSYYTVEVNGTMVRKYCDFMDREELMYAVERRRAGLERAIRVYMEEGPISVSEITLPAGKPGCQTENFKFQQGINKPSWKEITEDEAVFLVIFNMKQDIVGTFNGPMTISAQMRKFAKYYEGEWFVGETAEKIDMSTACSRGGSGDVSGEIHKMCILGLVLTYDPDTGFITMSHDDWRASKDLYPGIHMDEIGMLVARAEWPAKRIFHLDEVIGYLPCNVKWSNVLRFDPSNTEGKCLHFAASSKGTIFVIFSAIPDDKDTWYYVQISPYGVGIFKSQKLIVSTVDVNAVGLGADVLYQHYFACVKETSVSTVIEYGKSLGTSERGDVYLTMMDTQDPLQVRFWSFGNGDEPLEIVDAHIVSRHLTEANCRGDTSLDPESNMCVQNCHELCDPTRGCRGSSSSKPLASDCNACRYVKSGETGECLRSCPEGQVKDKDNVCHFLCKVVALGMESGKIADSQLTASSQYDGDHAASRGRLNMQKEGTKRGGWVSRHRNVNQYLQVDLGIVNTVMKVASQGRADYPQMVTKYKLEYSLDGTTFQAYRETGQVEDKIFDGNNDQNTIVTHEITNPPITARYIRFRTVSWKNGIAMRVELYGCEVKNPCDEKPCRNGGTCTFLGQEEFKCTCLAQYSGEICENKITDCYDNPTGVADIAKIPDAKMTASSKYSSNYEPYYGRLNGNRGDGWCSKEASSNNDWLQVDLGKPYTVCGVATQGDRNGNEWVTAFKLLFSWDGVSWNVYQGDTSKAVVFQRQGNNNQIDQHTLKLPVAARYVRFNPVARKKHNCLRVEVYGTIDENSGRQKGSPFENERIDHCGNIVFFYFLFF
ncbi:uncharacterized protein LOC144638115 isoform X2 [Oculina patagonica]